MLRVISEDAQFLENFVSCVFYNNVADINQGYIDHLVTVSREVYLRSSFANAASGRQPYVLCVSQRLHPPIHFIRPG